MRIDPSKSGESLKVTILVSKYESRLDLFDLNDSFYFDVWNNSSF